MKRFLALLAFLPALAFAEEEAALTLAKIGEALTAPNHVYGPSVTAEDLVGRVVLVWNVSDLVEPLLSSVRSGAKTDDKSADSPAGQAKAQSKALRGASKGALKDGRLLVIVVDAMPDDQELRRYRTESIRRLGLSFPVYSLDAKSQLFGADGARLAEVPSIEDLAEGDRLTNALKEAPDYYPGRLICFRTELHEQEAKNLLLSKNIDPVLTTLRRDAARGGPKGEEARRMVETVEAYLKDSCAGIENDLKNAPSRAVAAIERLKKTSPATAGRYKNALAGLYRTPEIKQLVSIREFVDAANAGKFGRGDTGRKADDALKKVEALAQHKNPAIAADANGLKAVLESLSSQRLAQEQAAAREQVRTRRAEERQRERESMADGSKSGPKSKRATAASVLAAVAGEVTLAPLMEELARLDDATCNYETLRNGYVKYEKQETEKGAAARALISAIDGMLRDCGDQLAAIQKTKQPLNIFDRNDWERLITVNFPSLQNQEAGKFALKLLRDSELRRIHKTLKELEMGLQDYDGSGEGRAAAVIQYRRDKLRLLLKSRKTSSPIVAMAVAQLDAMGYDEASIVKKLEEVEDELKRASAAAKSAERARKKAAKKQERGSYATGY